MLPHRFSSPVGISVTKPICEVRMRMVEFLQFRTFDAEPGRREGVCLLDRMGQWGTWGAFRDAGGKPCVESKELHPIVSLRQGIHAGSKLLQFRPFTWRCELRE